MLKLIGFLLSVGTLVSVHGGTRCTSATIKDDRELWIGGRRVIRDNLGVNTPRWSPDGQKLAYTNDFDLSSDPVSHIVVINRNGVVLETVPIPESAMFNFVGEMGWLNSTTIWIDGHVSPSAGMYEEFDLESREMRHETPGLFFSPSPDGQTLAYCEPGPRPAPPDYHPPLMLNKTAVRLPDAVSITGPLVWSPTGERLAVGVKSNGRPGVAFVGARGTFDHLSMLPPNGRTDALIWSGDQSVLVRPSGKQGTYQVKIDGTVQESRTMLRIVQRDEACRRDVAVQ